MKTEWVTVPLSDGDMLERVLGRNPLVAIHKYPGARHAFARKGGIPYSQPDAERALDLTVKFFERYLGGPAQAGTAA